MSTLTFDTLKFANRLKTAGVPAGQAEAEADALAEVLETNLGELATKEDLRHEIGDVRHEIGDLRKDLQRVEERFDTKLANLKFELLKWIMGIAIAQAGLIIGLLKFFPINS
jgi:hypothetical protein